MQEKGLNSLLVSKRTNVRYLSGFAGTAGVLVITDSQRKLFVDFRYIEQAALMAPEFDAVLIQGDPLEAAAEFLQDPQLGTVGFEHDTVTVEEYGRLLKKVPADRWQPVRLDGFRTVKTAAELCRIEAAAAIADAAFAALLPQIRVGVPERELAAVLEYEMRRRGSERTAFDTILASGPRSALPHGVASDKKIAAGDFVVIDFGAVSAGYHSDMTRTVCMGRASARQREVYGTVLAAQAAGLAAVRPGALCRDVDKAARDVITTAGFGGNFGHGLGHCVGLAIHENPRLAPAAGEARLESGMVVTVEPGVYLAGWGGVRIEDLVVVTDSGCRIISRTAKDLLELD